MTTTLPRESVARSSRQVGAPALPLLVETRFGVPQSGSSHVRRAHVAALLDRAADRRLTLVAAPTGFGKTTAVADWVRTRPGAAAWLTLEAADDDPLRFATYLVSAIRRAAPSVGADALSALQDPRVDIDARVIGSLVNDVAASPDRLVLILDDYHHLHEPATHAITRALLASLPPQLRLVISSRGDPALPLGRLRATDDLGEIRVEDLRFSTDEVRAFLDASLHGPVDAEAVAALAERTEGWPAAVNLAAMSLAAGTPPEEVLVALGSHRHLVDYLATEVLDAQTPAMREFLLRTSILDRLHGDLCDAVTGGTDGRTRLAELERANLFVSGLDEQRDWFRYHRLLREALRAQLAIEQPHLSPSLFLAAAGWYEAAGRFDEAIRAALDADDHEAAARIIGRRYLTFTRFGHVGELREHLAALDPERVGPMRGPMAFISALAAGLVGEPWAVVEEHLAVIDEAGIEPGLVVGIPTTKAAASFVRAMYPYGDVARLRAAGAALAATWPDDPLLGAAGQMAIGYHAYLCGDLAAARRALATFGDEPDVRLMSVFALSVRALAEVDLGHVDVARAIATAPHRAVVHRGLHVAVATANAHAALGAVDLAVGDLEAAVPRFDQALRLTRPTQPIQRCLALVLLASAREQLDDRAGARACLAEAQLLVDACADPGALGSRIRAVERRLGRSTGGAVDDPAAPTAAELRVLRLLASSLSQREIAGELYLSPDTVKTHIRRLYRKLGVATRGDAVMQARALRLL
jgi:LuxR family maltose regulon positive regulatory protein